MVRTSLRQARGDRRECSALSMVQQLEHDIMEGTLTAKEASNGAKKVTAKYVATCSHFRASDRLHSACSRAVHP